MFEAIISFLITICIFAIIVYIIIWVLGAIGLNIPPRIIQLFWVIVLLVAMLYLAKLVGPHLGTLHFMKALL